MQIVRPLVAVAALLAVATLAHAPVKGAARWDPIDPKELAETAPKVQRNADAEALLWGVRVEDRQISAHDVQTNFFHHVRIKIFTDRGREAHSRIELPHADTSPVVFVKK